MTSIKVRTYLKLQLLEGAPAIFPKSMWDCEGQKLASTAW